MKKVLLGLSLLAAFVSKGQIMQTNATPGGYQFVALKPDSVLIVPSGGDTPFVANKGIKYQSPTGSGGSVIPLPMAGGLYYRESDSTTWVHTNYRWIQLGGGNGSGIDTVTRRISGLELFRTGTVFQYGLTPGWYRIRDQFLQSTDTLYTTIPVACADTTKSRVITFYIDTLINFGNLVGVCDTTLDKPEVNPLSQLDLSFVIQTHLDSFPAVPSQRAWLLGGNTGVGVADVIGTINDIDWRWVRGGAPAGRIGVTNTSGGHNSMISITSGGRNTAWGSGALASATAGLSNTAIGFAALSAQTTQSNNTAIGDGAGSSTTGENNTFIGQGTAGFGSGSNKVMIGTYAGGNNISATNGGQSVSIGTLSGFQANWADNTSVGYGAASYCVGCPSIGSGNGNVSLGYASFSGKHQNSDANIAIGKEAGMGAENPSDAIQRPIDNADSNIFIGYRSGRYQSTSYNNIGIGTRISFLDTLGNGQIALGVGQGGYLGKIGTQSGYWGGFSTDASAVLKINSASNNQGVLFPIMNTTQMNAISSPASGLVITNSDSGYTPCWYDGAAWHCAGSGGGGGAASKFGVIGEDNIGTQNRFFQGGDHSFEESYVVGGTDSLYISKIPTEMITQMEEASGNVTLIQQQADAIFLAKTNVSTGQTTGIGIDDNALELISDPPLTLRGTSGSFGFRYHHYTPTLTGFNPLLIDTATGDVYKFTGDLSGASLWAATGNDISNTNSGNVGIGLNNPSELLTTNGGNIRFEDAPSVGVWDNDLGDYVHRFTYDGPFAKYAALIKPFGNEAWRLNADTTDNRVEFILSTPNEGYQIFRHTSTRSEETIVEWSDNEGSPVFTWANGTGQLNPNIGFTAAGLMGIGTTTLGSANLRVADLAGTGSRAVLADANGDLSAPVSDRSVKQNIQPITGAITKIMQLNPVTFEYKEGWKNYGKGTQIGFIAQDVQKVLPNSVFTTPSTGKLGYNEIDLVPLLTQVAQEQQKQIALIVARIEKLEKENAKLKKLLKQF